MGWMCTFVSYRAAFVCGLRVPDSVYLRAMREMSSCVCVCVPVLKRSASMCGSEARVMSLFVPLVIVVEWGA